MRKQSNNAIYGLVVLAACVGVFILVLWGSSSFFNSLAQSMKAIDSPTATVTQQQPAIEHVPDALVLVNQYRATKSLPALHLNQELENSAQAKADDMVALNYWSHNRPGKTPWDFFAAAGYNYKNAGEVLAKCWPNINDIVQAWINSPEHNAILIGNYTDVGFGITYNTRDHCNYVVGHFGSPVQTSPTELPVTGVSH